MKGWHLFSPIYADAHRVFPRDSVGWRCKHDGCVATWETLPPLDRRTGCPVNVSLTASSLRPGQVRKVTDDGAVNRAFHDHGGPASVASVSRLPRRTADVERPTPKTPNEGDKETTTVKARGCPGADAGCREQTTSAPTAGPRPERLTGQTAQAGYRQTPQGESNGCQHGPIHVPADGNTAGASHGRAGVAPPST